MPWSVIPSSTIHSRRSATVSLRGKRTGSLVGGADQIGKTHRVDGAPANQNRYNNRSAPRSRRGKNGGWRAFNSNMCLRTAWRQCYGPDDDAVLLKLVMRQGISLVFYEVSKFGRVAKLCHHRMDERCWFGWSDTKSPETEGLFCKSDQVRLISTMDTVDCQCSRRDTRFHTAPLEMSSSRCYANGCED